MPPTRTTPYLTRYALHRQQLFDDCVELRSRKIRKQSPTNTLLLSTVVSAAVHRACPEVRKVANAADQILFAAREAAAIAYAARRYNRERKLVWTQLTPLRPVPHHLINVYGKPFALSVRALNYLDYVFRNLTIIGEI